MKPKRDIRLFFRRAAVDTDAGTDKEVLAKVLAAHETASPNDSAVHRSNVRSTIMRSPITRLAVAAAISVAVLIGLSQLGGSSAGVAWGEVAQKIEANRGFTFHQWVRVSRPEHGDQITHITAYSAGSRLRQDWRIQPEGPLFKTDYYDFEARTQVSVRHNERTYLHVPMEERTLQSQQSGWLNPRDWIRQFLSSTYTKLGRRTIEGVLCEGIETTDPAFGDANPPSARSVARLWVSVETQYPVHLEASSTHTTARGDIQVEGVCDQFRWDVELSPDFFEPNIPSDYRQLQSSR